MKKRTLALVMTAVMLLSVILAGCGGAKPASKELDSALEKAQTTVTDFARDQRRNAAIFTHSLFEKAHEAAEKIGEETSSDKLKEVCEEMALDSVTVADENKIVTASYPQDEVGKKLKEIEEKKMFSAIASNNAIEMISDPELDTESGAYRYLIGVKRADGTGVVITELKTAEYAEVCGANLAEKCGENTVIIKDGEVLSSTLEGVKTGDAVDTLGISSEDLEKGSFTATVSGKSYTCKAAVSGDYTVICAEAA